MCFCYFFKLSIILSCNHSSFEDYPEIIKLNKLGDIYNEAKWEIYKLNSTYGKGNLPEFVVNFPNDSIFNKFSSISNIELDSKLKIEKFLGSENVINYIEVELILEEVDIGAGINEDEIWFKFVNKANNKKYWHKPSLVGLVHSIGFKKEKVIGYGYNDSVYYIEKYEESDESLERLINSGIKVNPWLRWYKNKKED